MAALDMKGAYPLDARTIDAVVRRTSPGNFALGYLDRLSFAVFYVGRADVDLRSGLHRWVGIPSRYERYAPATKAPWRLSPRAGVPQRAPALGRVDASEGGYTHFAYSYASSPAAALEKQCLNYADFGGSAGLDNARHPESAAGGREDVARSSCARRASRFL